MSLPPTAAGQLLDAVYSAFPLAPGARDHLEVIRRARQESTGKIFEVLADPTQNRQFLDPTRPHAFDPAVPPMKRAMLALGVDPRRIDLLTREWHVEMATMSVGEMFWAIARRLEAREHRDDLLPDRRPPLPLPEQAVRDALEGLREFIVPGTGLDDLARDLAHLATHRLRATAIRAAVAQQLTTHPSYKHLKKQGVRIPLEDDYFHVEPEPSKDATDTVRRLMDM